jgi:acyl-[acyl-carrier-protein]-phospholipid O-acyltransferase/long-chain-fatty-acid--[acyl-carrier-protein] ligase
MIFAGLALAGMAVAWLALAIWTSYRQRITLGQALAYTPLALIWRIDARTLRDANEPGPMIYVVTHRSSLDPALMLSLLPEDTLHILDGYSSNAAWLEPWRSLARTATFNPEHIFVSKRLVRVLRGGGRLCVYMPAEITPESRSFSLYRAVARIAQRADARIMPIHVAERGKAPRHAEAGEVVGRAPLAGLRIKALQPATIADLVAREGEGARNSVALFNRVTETAAA